MSSEVTETQRAIQERWSETVAGWSEMAAGVKAATIDVGVYSFNNFETLLATLRAAEMLGLDYTVETTPGEGWKLTLTHYAALADAEARRQDRREARRVRTREGGRNDG